MTTQLTIKQSVDRTARWTAISSTNVLDRDREIVSKQALELDVYRTNTYGDDSELRLYHIKGTRFGGAPDYRGVVDGHLVESGEVDNTPFAHAVVKFINAHPDGVDGSGFGVSIGFYGTPDDGGVFKQIQTQERSVLPLSQAANPFTRFSTEREKDSDMSLKQGQRELLQQLATDPDAQAVVQAILAAAEQGKALDSEGVQRKDASEKDVTSTNAQYAGGPGGIGSTPGVTGAPKKGVKSAPQADAGATAPVGSDIHGATDCTNCGHNASDHAKEKIAGGDLGACTVSGCDCKQFKMLDQDSQTAPEDKMVKALTLEDLAGAIDTHVKSAVGEALSSSDVMVQLVGLMTEQAKAFAEISERLVALESGEEQVKAIHETPRMSLETMLASRSKGTAINGNDPLARQAKAAEKEAEKEAAIQASVFDKLGFGKKE